MTHEDAQHLLAFLKLYKGKCDNIWGPMSKEAMTEFQQRFGGLEVNGQLNTESGKALRHAVAYWYDEVEAAPEGSSGDWRDEIEFFDIEKEFRCKCNGKYCNGFPHEPKEAMVRLADGARRHFGRPAIVVSGLRCPEWNRIQGGVENSQHIYGEACDIQIIGVSSAELLAYFQAQPGVRYAYAINGTNVHFDIPKEVR